LGSAPDRRAGYLGDIDWDRNWEPVVSSDDEDDDDMDEDEDDDDDDDTKTPSLPRVSGEVSGQIYNGRVVRDDVDDMVNHVVYHYFQAQDHGKVYQMPPELTEEKELVVAVLISKEEERRVELRAFPELVDALVLSVAPPPPPGPLPMQPPCTPPARPRRDATTEPWDPWPGATPGWPAGAPPVLGWAPRTPTPPPHQGLHRCP
jgi:hypothetical protein